nr:RES family NAD+ phosphorylase [Verminephrobacter eiseniae]
MDLPDNAQLLDVRSLESLPVHWRDDEPWTQDAGIRWRTSGASLGLWVPSAVEPEESNLILNPDHAAFASIVVTIERNPFQFDARLFACVACTAEYAPMLTVGACQQTRTSKQLCGIRAAVPALTLYLPARRSFMRAPLAAPVSRRLRA